MRKQVLRRMAGNQEEFRDPRCKKHVYFMCATPRYAHLCNTDHIKQQWGVGERRMERGCHRKKLKTVKRPLRIHEQYTQMEKDGLYEN